MSLYWVLPSYFALNFHHHMRSKWPTIIWIKIFFSCANFVFYPLVGEFYSYKGLGIANIPWIQLMVYPIIPKDSMSVFFSRSFMANIILCEFKHFSGFNSYRENFWKLLSGDVVKIIVKWRILKWWSVEIVAK